MRKRIMEEEDRQKAPPRVELYRDAELPRDPMDCFPWTTVALVSLASFAAPFVPMGVWAGVASRCRRLETVKPA